MKRSVRLALALGSLLAGQVSAADLYTAEVALIGTGAQARDAAANRALDVVLGRLLPGGEDAARARAALAGQAGTLLAGSRQTHDGRRLEARFDAPAVHEQLRRAGLTPWGEPRPRVLLWLAFDGGDGVALVGADSPLAAEVARAGARYGVPVELPLLDPEERAQVDVGALVGLDWETLAAASVRYGPDAFAGLLVTGDAARLRGRVNLSRPDGETRSATLQADTLDALFGAALRHVAAELAGFYLAENAAPDVPPDPPAPASAAAPVVPFERPLAPDAPSPRQQAFVPLATAPEAAAPEAGQDTPTQAPETHAASVAPPAGAAPVYASAPPVAGAADGVVVDVQGVGSATAYQQTQAQLRALSGVRAVHALAARGGVLTLEVRYPAGAAALREALRADALFEVIETAGDRLALRYRGG